MKRLVLILMVVVVASFCYGQQNPNYSDMQVTSVYVPKTLNALTLYCVGGATTTDASYGVFGSTGIELKTVDGKYPGTNRIEIATHTVTSLIAYINSLSAVKTGSEGGWVATINNGYYGGDPATMLTNKVFTGCLGVANIVTLTSTGTTGVSYTLPAASLPTYQRYCITGASLNATFAAGHPVVRVYDGSSTSSTVLTKQVLYVSALDGQLDIPSTCGIVGSRATATRVDMVSSSGDITDGFMTLYYVITRQ